MYWFMVTSTGLDAEPIPLLLSRVLILLWTLLPSARSLDIRIRLVHKKSGEPARSSQGEEIEWAKPPAGYLTPRRGSRAAC